MKYQCLMVDDDITIAETTAEYFNIFDVREQDGEAHDDESGLDVELGLDRGLKPVRNSYCVRDQQADQQGPESPFKVTVEGEFCADEADYQSDKEKAKECRNIFLNALSLKLDTECEKGAKHDYSDN